MPYTQGALTPAQPNPYAQAEPITGDTENYQPGLGTYIRAVASETFNTNDTGSLINWWRTKRAQGDYGYEPLSLDEQQEEIDRRGLNGYFKPMEGENTESLRIRLDNRERELRNRYVREHNKSLLYGGIGLATGALVESTSISNWAALRLGSAIGAGRYATQMLQQYGKSSVGRFAVRAGEGFLSNVLVNTPEEFIIQQIQNSEFQSEYGWMDSLTNLGFSGLFGAGMRAIGGGISDWRLGRAGVRQPWQFTPITDVTERSRLDFANRQFEAFRAAGVDLPEEIVRQNALASAALFDARSRAWSYDTGKNVSEYYRLYGPEFRAGITDEAISKTPVPESIRTASEVNAVAAPEPVDYRIGADGSVIEGAPQVDPNRYQMMTEAIDESGRFPRENQIKNDIRREIGAAKDDKIFIHRKPGEEYYTVYRGDKNAKGYTSAEEVAGFKVLAVDDSPELQNREKQYALLRDTQPDILTPEQLTVRSYAEANKISVAEAARRLEAEGYAVPRGEAQANGRRGRVRATEPITGKVMPETRIDINRAAANVAEALDAPLPVSREALDVSGRVLGIANERVGAAIDAAVRSATPDAVRLADNIARTGEINLNAPELTRTVQAVGELANTIANEITGAADAVGTQVVRAANEILPRLEAAVNEATRVTGAAPSVRTPEAPVATPRTRARINWQDGRAVISFFQNSDLTSAPHELFHIFRREMAETAADPHATTLARSQWQRIQDFAGAKQGGIWTPEMEERFARAGERFLFEGRSPSPALDDVMDKMKQWFGEVYANADSAGLEISPQMRQVFGEMFSIPAEQVGQNFAYALTDLLSRNTEEELANMDIGARTESTINQIDNMSDEARVRDYAQTNSEMLDNFRSAAQGDVNTGRIYAELEAELQGITDDLGYIQRESEAARGVITGVLSGYTEPEITARLQEAGFTPEEATALYQAVNVAASKGMDEAEILAKTKAVTDRKQFEALARQRATILNHSKRAELLDSVINDFAGNEVDGIMAALGGIQRPRQGSRFSVDAIQNQLEGKYIGMLGAEIKQLDTVTQALAKAPGEAVDMHVARAMWSLNDPDVKYNGPKEYMDLAKIYHKVLNVAKTDANNAGAYIQDLRGYILHQSHDQEKIYKAGFSDWKGFVESRADWNRIRDGRFLNDLEGRERFLQGFYEGVSTGRHYIIRGDDIPLTRAGTVGSEGARMSHERLLHFKDADSWLEYYQQFGKGSIYNGVTSELERYARSTGLMRKLGPSPHSVLDRTISDTLDNMRARGDIQGMNKLQSATGRHGKITNIMYELDGSVNIAGGGNKAFAKFMSDWRILNNTRMLGGAIISQIGDFGTAMSEFRYQGMPMLRTLFDDLARLRTNYGTAEYRKALTGTGVFFDSMAGRIANKFNGVSDEPGRLSKLQDVLFKWTGLENWDTHRRASAVLQMGNYLSFDREFGWDNLKPQRQRVLSMAGITPDEWDVIRAGNLIDLEGRNYLLPQSVYEASDEVIANYLSRNGRAVNSAAIDRARTEIADKFGAYFWDRGTYAVINPDARTRAIMHQGLGSGTISGEALRAATQFKGFPLAAVQRTFGREVYGYGADGIWEGLKGAFKRYPSGERSGIFAVLAGTTIFGMISMQAKQLLSGRTIRPLDDPHTWQAAMAQGGGVGILGDFLFAEQSSYGSGFWSTAFGPQYSDLANIFDMYNRAKEGDFNAAQAVSQAYRFLPFNNVFYTRAAANHLILYNLQEWLNPGYKRRMKRRVKRETGQEFWLDPQEGLRLDRLLPTGS